MKIATKNDITPKSYRSFSKEMRRLGYTKETEGEKLRTEKKIIVGKPRRQQFKEDTWKITINGFTGKVQTTVALKNKELLVAESDQGWAVITKGDKGVFYMQPFNRKNYFFENLLNAARIIKEMISHLPLCEQCNASMMFQNRKTDSRFYELVCPKHSSHPVIKNPYSIAYAHLDGSTYQWLSKRLAKSKYYKRTAPRKGIHYGQAKRRRISWPLNQENVEKI